jgi:hypothetical protein
MIAVATLVLIQCDHLNFPQIVEPLRRKGQTRIASSRATDIRTASGIGKPAQITPETYRDYNRCCIMLYLLLQSGKCSIPAPISSLLNKRKKNKSESKHRVRTEEKLDEIGARLD